MYMIMKDLLNGIQQLCFKDLWYDD